MSQERGVAARRLRSAAPRLARGRSRAGRRRSRGRVGESSQPARPGPPLGFPPSPAVRGKGAEGRGRKGERGPGLTNPSLLFQGAEWEARLAALRGAGRHAEVPISSAFPGRGEAPSAGRGPRSQSAPWELTGPRSACCPRPRCHVSAGLRGGGRRSGALRGCGPSRSLLRRDGAMRGCGAARAPGPPGLRVPCDGGLELVTRAAS